MLRVVFDSVEYDRCIVWIKEWMVEWGLDVFFVSDFVNMNYFIGYDGWLFYVYQGVVVMWDCDEFVWVGCDMDVNGVCVMIMLSEESIWLYSDDYVQLLYDFYLMDFVVVVLEDFGVDDVCVGFEMDVYYFIVKLYMCL